jgi:hydroxymethylbilane synthase
MLEAIHDVDTGKRLAAERAFLAGLDGSCETPIAGLAELDGGTLRLRGEILRPDGSEVLNDDRSAAVEDGAELGSEMARDLRAQAGEDFFDWIAA